MSDSEIVIKVENLWKQYRYGIISHRTLHKDLQSWWPASAASPIPTPVLAMSKAQREEI